MVGHPQIQNKHIKYVIYDSGKRIVWVSPRTTVMIKVQALDSVGFTSDSVTESTFTIENPLLINTTTAPTTTTTAATPTTTTPTVSSITPSWNILFLLLFLFVMVPLRLHKKKT